PQTEPQTEPAPETEPAEATPETPPERQETKAPDEPVERAQTERRTLASAASVRGNAGLSGTERVSDQPDTEGETDRAGAQTLAADHDARVLARFSAAKRYPAAARLRGQEGTVAVRFTLDRTGAVLAAELAGASGRRTLDKAALAQVHRAAPYPAAPEGTRWRQRTYVSSVAFHLNR
ncbi:hypothetical protein CCR85_12825, partial [Rhodothalassium salexigens]|uniref:energy transducer TonB n=1 Tax=Rhodothalassium salexigens TaxID=1086 RepID=UPI0019134083